MLKNLAQFSLCKKARRRHSFTAKLPAHAVVQWQHFFVDWTLPRDRAWSGQQQSSIRPDRGIEKLTVKFFDGTKLL